MSLKMKIECSVNTQIICQLSKKDSGVFCHLIDKVHSGNFNTNSPLFLNSDVVVSKILKSNFGHSFFLPSVFLLYGRCEVFYTGACVGLGDILVFLRMGSTTHTIPL